MAVLVTAATAEEKTAAVVKTAAMMGTTAVIGTITTAEERTTAVVRTAVMTGIMALVKTTAGVAKALKVFKKDAIITVGEETAIVVARASKKSSAASFKRRGKYI